MPGSFFVEKIPMETNRKRKLGHHAHQMRTEVPPEEEPALVQEGDRLRRQVHQRRFLALRQVRGPPDHAQVEGFRRLEQCLQELRVRDQVLQGVEDAVGVPVLRLHHHLQRDGKFVSVSGGAASDLARAPRQSSRADRGIAVVNKAATNSGRAPGRSPFLPARARSLSCAVLK